MENKEKVGEWAAHKYAGMSYNKDANPISYHEQYMPYLDGFIGCLNYLAYLNWRSNVYAFRPRWDNYVRLGIVKNGMSINRKTFMVTGSVCLDYKFVDVPGVGIGYFMVDSSAEKG